jgi:hypothetical protein
MGPKDWSIEHGGQLTTRSTLLPKPCVTVAGPRVMHPSNMMLQAQQWIERTHPRAWRRRSGRDHIWLSPNDEGDAATPPSHQTAVVIVHR